MHHTSTVATLSLLCAMLLPACAGDPGEEGEEVGSVDEAIVGGHLDWNHPEVGKLLLPNGVCTGTLVGRRVVLAAAHCFAYKDQFIPKDAGEFVITRPGDDVPNQYVNYIYHVIRFTSLGTAVGSNDLAIAQLDRVVPGSIAIPYKVASSFPNAGTNTVIYGYGGHTLTGPIATPILKYRRDFAWRTTGAAGLLSINGVIAPGDSGGPVMTPNGIVGVTSARKTIAPYQDAFGNTVANHPWIHDWAVAWN